MNEKIDWWHVIQAIPVALMAIALVAAFVAAAAMVLAKVLGTL